MNDVLLAVLLTCVAITGLVTVAIRDPLRQTISSSFLSLFLALLFFAVQAPDVGLSELVIGGAAVPLMLLLAIAKIRQQNATRRKRES